MKVANNRLFPLETHVMISMSSYPPLSPLVRKWFLKWQVTDRPHCVLADSQG